MKKKLKAKNDDTAAVIADHVPKRNAHSSTANRNTIERLGSVVSRSSPNPTTTAEPTASTAAPDEDTAWCSEGAGNGQLDLTTVRPGGATTVTEMPVARPTSAADNDRPRARSIQPPPERPITIWVMLLRLAYPRISAVRFLGGDANGARAQPLRQPQRFFRAPERCPIGDLTLDRFDMQRDPIRFERRRHAAGRTHHGLGLLVAADAGDEPLRRRPWPLDALLAQLRQHVLVHAIRRSPQRQLTQRRQVVRLEELIGRALGVLREIDLALLQALDQLLRRQVDHHDLVRVVEHSIRHRLSNGDAGDALDDIGQAFQVLHVERGPHVDAGAEDLDHVLIALGMQQARRVGVRELVDQQQPRTPGDSRLDIEFHQRSMTVAHRAARQHLEPVEQGRRLRTSVRFDDTDDDIDAFRLLRPGGGEHGVRFTDAGSHAEKDVELAPRFPLGKLEQGLGRGAAYVVALKFVGHAYPARVLNSASRARLRATTLTRGSPMTPNIGKSV